MKTILITGGCGVVGSELTTVLQNNGYNVLTIGRGSRNTIKHDLTEPIPIDIVNDRIDYIVHLAGVVHNKKHGHSYCKSSYNKDLLITNNLTNFINAKKISSLLFFSSVAVYGREFGNNIRESSITKPRSSYGKIKLYSENHFINNLTNCKVICLRVPLVVTTKLIGNLRALDSLVARGLFLNFNGNKGLKSFVLGSKLGEEIPSILTVKSGIYNIKHGDLPFNFFIDCFSMKHKKILLKIPFFLIEALRRIVFVFSFSNTFKSLTIQISKVSRDLTFSTHLINTHLTLYKAKPDHVRKILLQSN